MLGECPLKPVPSFTPNAEGRSFDAAPQGRMGCPHPASKAQGYSFYQGQSKYSRASLAHAFYDPTQGGFSKRWILLGH
jgi:hypothetical protein